jgi:hypothetical protein
MTGILHELDVHGAQVLERSDQLSKFVAQSRLSEINVSPLRLGMHPREHRKRKYHVQGLRGKCVQEIAPEAVRQAGIRRMPKMAWMPH